MTIEFMFGDIVELIDIEKYFKKNVGEGEGLFVASDSHKRVMWVVNLNNKVIDGHDVVKSISRLPSIKKEIDTMNPKYLRLECYSSLDDFDYGEHIKEEDILR